MRDNIRLFIKPFYLFLDKSTSVSSQDKPERDRALYSVDRHDKYSTAKCIDCSRESWKSKKFTTTGMNTEVSVNPGIDIDLRVFSGINGANNVHYVHPQPPNSSSYNGRLTRLRTTVMRQPQPPVGPPPPTIVHVSSARKDIPAIQVNNVKSMAPTSELELPRQRDASPALSPSPGREIVPAAFSSFQGTQITYPRVTAAFHSDLRYDHAPPPLRSPRVRSPHDIPRSPSHMNGDAITHHAHMQHPVSMKEDTPDGNPTVYVLPNDFDVNGGYESHFQPYGPMSHDDVRRHEEFRRQEEMRRHEELRRQREARQSEEPPRIDASDGIPVKRSKQDTIPSFALPTQVCII